MTTKLTDYAWGIAHWMAIAQTYDLPFPCPKELLPCAEAVRARFRLWKNSIGCDSAALQSLKKLRKRYSEARWNEIMDNLNLCLGLISCNAKANGWDPENGITAKL